MELFKNKYIIFNNILFINGRFFRKKKLNSKNRFQILGINVFGKVINKCYTVASYYF